MKTMVLQTNWEIFTPKLYRRAIGLLFFVVTASVTLNASAQPTCPLPAEILTATGNRLPLVGSGVRTYWFKKINAVALYAPSKPANWATIQQSSGEAQAIVVLMVDFSQKQLQASWAERFEALLTEAQRATLEPSISKYLSLLPAAKPGDRLSFHSSDSGLALSQNGMLLGVVGDLKFGRLVLSSWFGDQPASAELKAAVFAGKTYEDLPCQQ